MAARSSRAELRESVLRVMLRCCEMFDVNCLNVGCHFNESFQRAKRIPENCHLVAGGKKFR